MERDRERLRDCREFRGEDKTCDRAALARFREAKREATT